MLTAPLPRKLDMDGDNRVRANKEGLVLLRSMLGFSGAAVVNGTGISQGQWDTVRNNPGMPTAAPASRRSATIRNSAVMQQKIRLFAEKPAFIGALARFSQDRLFFIFRLQPFTGGGLWSKKLAIGAMSHFELCPLSG